MHPDPKPAPGKPFSFLSKSQEKDLYTAFSYKNLSKGDVLFTQEISRVKQVYILTKGRLEFYYIKGSDRLIQGQLSPGAVFGGLSVLFNDHMAIHTVAALEDTRAIAVDASIIEDLCLRNSEFFDYFALEVGRCMANKVFMGVLGRRIQDKSLNLPFFNRPVSAIFRPNIATCSEDDPVRDAALKMNRQKTSAILVKSKTRQIKGIVTDADLKNRVVSEGRSPLSPVSEILSSPLISIPAGAQIFEAFLKMIHEDKRHLAVTGKSGEVSGIISEKDLIEAQTRSTFLLIKAVKSARKMEDIDGIHDRLEKMLLEPISNGVNADYITQLITTFSDAIIHKVMDFSIADAGPPPCRFAFLTMGSEGRGEQTLISDQDNAILFEGTEDPEQADMAKQYFDTLARGICRRLDRAGYRFCEGNNMARNPDWCQPMNVWKTRFSKWIRAASPEDLLYSSIFFDFRGTYGDQSLATELKNHLLTSISRWPGFLRNMSENAIYFKPPIGRFGKFMVETKGDHKGALDIKLAMLPIIDFSRIYALKNGIAQTNTLTRLFRLYTRHALTAREYTNIIQSYNFLMGLRFKRQITTIMDEGEQPDNFINPANLSSLDQIMLKESFKLIEKLQHQLSIEFTGVT
ncbi:MAG: DUF294 nucleotidyltransferase-like domain-containing protein [Desulfobacterales bacterium]|nr:DUF294 nucleotidyltransferase-like domain-containing protein [Desulfobacterales bacterium]